MSGYLVPIVIEKGARGERAYDIFSRLLKDRIVFVGGAIDDDVANLVIAQMLFLANEDPKADIHLYINSPGGDITALLAIYDTIQFVKNEISTFCYGQAASAAAVLLSAGAPGKRHALPHSRILMHQPYGGVGGQAEDIRIQAEQIIKSKNELIRIISRHTGQSENQVRKDSERDKYFNAMEAKEYGLVDEVIASTKLIKKK